MGGHSRPAQTIKTLHQRKTPRARPSPCTPACPVISPFDTIGETRERSPPSSGVISLLPRHGDLSPPQRRRNEREGKSPLHTNRRDKGEISPPRGDFSSRRSTSAPQPPERGESSLPPLGAHDGGDDLVP